MRVPDEVWGRRSEILATDLAATCIRTVRTVDGRLRETNVGI